MVPASLGPGLESQSVIFRDPHLRNYFATGDLMRKDDCIQETPVTTIPEKARKPGRPPAIQESLYGLVVKLYRKGYGYRAIASLLAREYHINPDYSSVRRALLRLGLIRKTV